MIDFEVDCPLFLRLLNEPLGGFSLYRISVAGVEAAITEQRVQDSNANAQESAVLLEFIRDARLSFPSTSALVVEFLVKNSDFDLCFPWWFEPVVVARDVDAARAILEKAGSLSDAEISKGEHQRDQQNDNADGRFNVVKWIGASDLAALRSKRSVIDLIHAALPASTAVRARKAAHAMHVPDRLARENAIRMYHEGNYASKRVAAEVIAPKVHRSPVTVRKWFQGA